MSGSTGAGPASTVFTSIVEMCSCTACAPAAASPPFQLPPHALYCRRPRVRFERDSSSPRFFWRDAPQTGKCRYTYCVPEIQLRHMLPLVLVATFPLASPAVVQAQQVQTEQPPICRTMAECRQMALDAAMQGEYERFHDFAWRA